VRGLAVRPFDPPCVTRRPEIFQFLKIAFALAIASWALPVRSQEQRFLGYVFGADLLRRCTAPSAAGLDYCFGFIAAAHDTARAYETWFGFRDMCVPAGTPQGELRDVVVSYLRANEEQQSAQAASLVILALRARYGCAPVQAPSTERPPAIGSR
jgi:hypothetical protein